MQLQVDGHWVWARTAGMTQNKATSTMRMSNDKLRVNDNPLPGYVEMNKQEYKRMAGSRYPVDPDHEKSILREEYVLEVKTDALL
ncbi:MAG: hypothetical protein GKC07_04260 [Methanomicrobiales archaeon]|nr:hypothetical protein [Methanomicrobiales archaeon]